MTPTELAAVVIAVAGLATTAVLMWVVVGLRRSAVELGAALDEARRTLDNAVTRVADQVDAIDNEVHRAEGLLDTAEAITARAETLSRVTYGAVARPVIRTAAVVKGTSRAARLLRRSGDIDEKAG